MPDDVARDRSAEPGLAAAQRRRPRPGPGRERQEPTPTARRRLGRFFAAERSVIDEQPTPSFPEHFPGVPRPDLILTDPPPDLPPPRPRPRAADRPRPQARGRERA